MKILQELQSPVISAIKPRVIAAEIEEIARGVRHFEQLFRVNKDLVGKPGDYVDFKYRYYSTTPIFQKVTSVLTEVSWSAYGWSYKRITVERWGGKLMFDRGDLEAAHGDVLAETIYEAGLDFAEMRDLEAKKALLKAVEVTDTDVTASYASNYTQLGSYPVVYIESVSGSITGYSSMDYFKGRIEPTSKPASGTVHTFTVKYWVTGLPSTQVLDAVTKDAFGFKDIRAMKTAVTSKNYHPTVAVATEIQMNTLLLDTDVKFVDASVYGAREALLNGEIGKVLGLKMLPTTRQWPAVALCLDVDHAGRLVEKKALQSIRKEKPELYGFEYDMWAFFKFGLIKEDAVGIVVNVGGAAASW